MENNPSLFYRLVAFGLRCYFRLYHRVNVQGWKNIPTGVPVIVACNHVSNLDPPFVGAFFPQKLYYLAKDSLFKNPVLGRLITALGALSVDRGDSRKAGLILKMLLSHLQEGKSILIFPEGTRSSDGKLKPLEGGAAWLAQKTGALLLPVYVGGSLYACPKGKIPRPCKLRLYWGKPIDSMDIVSKYGEKEARGEILRRLSGALHALEEKDLSIL